MSIVSIFILLVIGFMIIGFIAVAFQKNDDYYDETDEEEYSSQVVVSQQVPSVFDTFKDNKH